MPEFWEWLEYQGRNVRVKICLEVYEELKAGNDSLAVWAKRPESSQALLLEEEADPHVVASVVDFGYADDLADDEVEKLGRDPFVISYAHVSPSDRCVVTTERSKPRRQRANRHLPDVCNALGVLWCDTFEFLRELDFKTSWRSHSDEYT